MKHTVYTVRISTGNQKTSVPPYSRIVWISSRDSVAIPIQAMLSILIEYFLSYLNCNIDAAAVLKTTLKWPSTINQITINLITILYIRIDSVDSKLESSGNSVLDATGVGLKFKSSSHWWLRQQPNWLYWSDHTPKVFQGASMYSQRLTV